MLPDPLHPAVVHFPIVLSFLLPLVAVIALWRIRRGAPARRTWAAAVAAAAALSLSAWVAVETGEGQEERVEDVVAHTPMEAHEEAAERFLVLSGVVLAVTGGGMLGGRLGTAARLAAAAGSLGLVAAGALVGHSGGQLVYRYGAAAAYTAQTTSSGGAAAQSSRAASGQGHAESDRD